MLSRRKLKPGLKAFLDTREDLVPVAVKIERSLHGRLRVELGIIDMSLTDFVRASIKRFLLERGK